MEVEVVSTENFTKNNKLKEEKCITFRRGRSDHNGLTNKLSNQSDFLW